jgi:hypothetical protein
MIVCCTGWDLNLKYLPFLPSIDFAEIQPKLYGRFLHMDYPGLFMVSIANGFQCASVNAHLVSECVAQILDGTWKQPSKEAMEKQIKDVVLSSVALTGGFMNELEDCGFKVTVW